MKKARPFSSLVILMRVKGPSCEPCFKILICVWWLLVLLFLISCNLSCEGGGENTCDEWDVQSLEITLMPDHTQNSTIRSNIHRLILHSNFTPAKGNIIQWAHALSEKWTSFYVLYSGGHKCNSLWGVSLRSDFTQIWRKDLRRKPHKCNLTFDAPCLEKNE